MNREIKFRAWDKKYKTMYLGDIRTALAYPQEDIEIMQFTGLQDKNGYGTIEVYEGDIIGTSSVVGNIYGTEPREVDLVIPSITSEEWHDTYQEAVARGFGYAK